MDLGKLTDLHDRVRDDYTGSGDSLDQAIFDLIGARVGGLGHFSTKVDAALLAVVRAYPEPEMQRSILSQALELGKRKHPPTIRQLAVTEWLPMAILEELLTALIVETRTGGS